MTLTVILIAAVFLISLVLTMVGLGGGLIFSPLFLILGFAKSEAASASLFLNLIAAASAAYTYSRKKMVDFALAVPLIVSNFYQRYEPPEEDYNCLLTLTRNTVCNQRGTPR